MADQVSLVRHNRIDLAYTGELGMRSRKLNLSAIVCHKHLYSTDGIRQLRRWDAILHRRIRSAATCRIDLNDLTPPSTSALTIDGRILILNDSLKTVWRGIADSKPRTEIPNENCAAGNHIVCGRDFNDLAAGRGSCRYDKVNLTARNEVEWRFLTSDQNPQTADLFRHRI